jgi:hypothetical protein
METAARVWDALMNEGTKVGPQSDLTVRTANKLFFGAFSDADAILCTHLTTPCTLHICFQSHPQVLFRVALALLKLHEPLLLAQDNPGELLHVTRRAAAEAFDRDALMKVVAACGAVVSAFCA